MSAARYQEFVDTVPTMPAGLDQQNRYPTRSWGNGQPMAAEACTDEGHIDPRASAIFWSAYIALLVVVMIAVAAAYLP